MKMLPVQLSLNPPLGLWSDVLWRCPPAPPSQLAELKTQLPPSLPSDPRLWGREDVNVFLRFCEREFDLPKLDHDLFQMNGKALCLLTRADFGHRCPGAGDVLHNVLQMLIIESHMMQWHLPNSPVTPTSRYPLSPHSHPPTPTWPPIAPPENAFHNTHMHHFMAPNSVTLSPPPSVDSQASSPPQGQDQSLIGATSSNSNGSNVASCSSSGSTSSNSSVNSTPSITLSGNNSTYGSNHTTTSIGSNHSDSDEESYSEPASKIMLKNNAAMAAAAMAQYSHASPPSTPVLKDMPKSLTQQIATSFINSWQQSTPQQHSQKSANSGGSVSAPTTPSFMQSVKREFFPENTEPNTNGRLLWDFLQQLLNDRNQKYSDLIAWKCRDTGVFKIVDPAGLAKLWGIQKNHLSMNYDKMSRALRYYYRVNILRKVQGERHCYQFLRNPSELKNIKNISLLRQSVNNSGNSTSGTNANSSTNGASGSGVQSSNLSPTANNNSGWSVPHPTMQSSSASNVSTLQLPQRPASRSSNHMSLPSISTSAAAAAAVAAATAAGYGPPPTSPLFMHAINGAFQYLSSNAGPPPNSPAPPSTSNEKFQFSPLKMEHNGQDCSEDMKPTDLSVAGTAASNSEKRPYSSSSPNEECYPLIRNSDGLTTIKLIRYNDGEVMKSSTTSSSTALSTANRGIDRRPSSESPKHHMTQQQDLNVDDHSDPDVEQMENVTNSCTESTQYDVMMPTDLRK